MITQTFIALQQFPKSFAFESTRECKPIVILIICNSVEKSATILVNLLQFILFHASKCCNTWWMCVNNCIDIWIRCIDGNVKIDCSFLRLLCNYLWIFCFIGQFFLSSITFCSFKMSLIQSTLSCGDLRSFERMALDNTIRFWINF